jgi:hypothetical protein
MIMARSLQDMGKSISPLIVKVILLSLITLGSVEISKKIKGEFDS